MECRLSRSIHTQITGKYSQPKAKRLTMTALKVVELYLLLMLTVGCLAHRHPMPAQLLLDPACLTAPIMMQRCDLESATPCCRTIKVRYRKGCERLEVLHVQQDLSEQSKSPR